MHTDTRAEARLEQSLSAPNRAFAPNLDFIRAVAVILVVVDHTLLALHVRHISGINTSFVGLIGVWMFFVHTALVLMWSLERKPYTLDFYIRRVFRIYPLALTAIAAALLTRAPLIGTIDNYFQYRSTSPGNLLATSLLVYNLVPAQLGFHPIVNVIWTLPLEIQMYLLLPVLFSFASRERTLWPLLLIWCLSVGLSYVYFKADMNFISAIPNFLPGVIAFVAFTRFRPSIPAWVFPPFLLLLIYLVLKRSSVPSGWILSLVLGLALPQFRSFKPSAFTLACNHLARYSYGIYLVHPFALVLGFYLLRTHSLALKLAVELATISVVSVAAYHLVEKPMIDLGSRLAARLEIRALERRPAEQRPTL